jgi:hypothetical protein
VYRVVEEGSNNVFALKRMLVSVDEMDLVKREVSLMVRCNCCESWPRLALSLCISLWGLASGAPM